MANTKSAIKAARQNVRRAARNKAIKTRLKTLHKKLVAAEGQTDAAAKKTAAIDYISALDKAVKTGLVHRNAAARAKSHTAKHVFAPKTA